MQQRRRCWVRGFDGLDGLRAGAHVGGDHARILENSGRRAGREHPALLEHGHLGRQAGHQVEVVFDDHHGGADRRDRAYEFNQSVKLVHRQAGGGLVEQQQARSGDQRASDLGQSLLAVGHFAGGHLGARVQTDEAQVAQRFGSALGTLASGAGKVERHRSQSGLLARKAAEHDVFQHRQAGHQFGRLEGATDPVSRQAVSGAALDRCVGHADLTAVARVVAGDQVEQGGLARAVRPDQRVDAACGYID